MRVETLLLVAAGMVVVPVATTSHAEQARPRAGKTSLDAAKKKREGDAALRVQRYADALAAYEAAYAIAPEPLLRYDRSRALEGLERWEEAIAELTAFEREASPQLREQAPEVLDHLRALKRKLATVRFVVRPHGAKVLVRGGLLGAAPLETPVRVVSGKARIEVEADGFVAYARDHYLGPGEQTTLEIELAPARRAAPPPPRPRENVFVPQPVPTESGERQSIVTKWWFWTAAGAVVVGGAAAAFVLTRPPEQREADLGQITAPLVGF